MKRENGWRRSLRQVTTMREELPAWQQYMFFALAIVVILSAYSAFAYLGDNTMIPKWGELFAGFGKMFKDPRSGEYVMWKDSITSFSRLVPAVALASAMGVVLGMYMGVYNAAEAMFGRVLNFQENIVPNAAMVVFLTLFGFAFNMYLAVIVFGILPVIAGRVYLAVKEVHNDYIYSAKTLGGSPTEIIWSILFFQVMPQIIAAIRSSIGLALILLVATEWIAGNAGFGYRFMKLYRAARMDVIFPYLLYLGFLGIGLQILFNKAQHLLCPWYTKEN
jgi:NitT/TauT family transport system permease protein